MPRPFANVPVDNCSEARRVTRDFFISSSMLAAALIISGFLIQASGAAWLHILFRFSKSQSWVLDFDASPAADILKIVLVGLSLQRILRRFSAHA